MFVHLFICLFVLFYLFACSHSFYICHVRVCVCLCLWVPFSWYFPVRDFSHLALCMTIIVFEFLKELLTSMNENIVWKQCVCHLESLLKPYFTLHFPIYSFILFCYLFISFTCLFVCVLSRFFLYLHWICIHDTCPFVWTKLLTNIK